MKKARLLVAAALLAVATTASAQFTNSSSSSSSANVGSNEGWSTFYVQYNPIKAHWEDDGEDEDYSYNGITIGYNHAFSVSKSIPLFVEAGLGLQYAMYKDEVYIGYDDVTYEDVNGDDKRNILSLKVPVSLMYKWNIPNAKVSLMPFLGLAMRFNLLANRSVTNDDYDFDEDYNMFDEDDMGEDNTWSRFQVGWQIGVNAQFNNSWLVGVSYGTDFSEIAENTKLKTTSITLGYCF